MPIPLDFLQCVCFLCAKRAEGGTEYFEYGGTAFFVSVPSEAYPDEYAHLYLVTARHCVHYRDGSRRDLYIRLNKKDGTATKPMPLPYEWLFPDDDAVDLAIMDFEKFDDPNHEYLHVPIASAATETPIRHHGISIGSEVFVTGLFTQRIGKQRNLPIVRTGIIASMPDELEDTNTGLPYNAYLIEMQSISGLSGSPVFVRSSRSYVAGDTKQYYTMLLGLVRGHFDTKRLKENWANEPVRFSDDEWDKIHNGISIVTPVQEIVKLLNSEEAMKQRAKKEKELKEQHVQTLDSGFSDKPVKRQSDELTKEDFESALKRASRKTSEPES